MASPAEVTGEPYSWEVGPDRHGKMEARREVLLTMDVAKDPVLVGEWMKLTEERAKASPGWQPLPPPLRSQQRKVRAKRQAAR
jgi:hypothetical protein